MSSPALWGPNNTSSLLQNQVLAANGTVLSSDGAKNYIKNATFENGLLTGWSLGAVTAPASPTFFPTGTPTFGSGASGNLSISIVSSGQLAGTKSLSYASSAATTGGNFVASDAFTIDIEDQAKVLQFKFSYSAVTNPSNANWSGTTSNSFGVAIYDVTNSAWIQPAGCFNLVQSSGVGIASGTFQTSSSGTSYRLCVYNANATSGAVTVYFDSFFVGPQLTAAGAAVSDWQSYSLSITATTTNPTKGTVNLDKAFWRRVGDSVEIQYQYRQTSAGTAGSGTYLFSIPAGLVIDSNKTGTGTSSYNTVGTMTSLAFSGQAFVYDTTHIALTGLNNSTGPVLIASGADDLSNANAQYSFFAKVPIVGWSSNTVMSNDTDTRVVTFSAYVNSAVSVPSGTATVVHFDAITNDSHGAYDTSNYRYRIPVSGSYRFIVGWEFPNVGAASDVQCIVRVNGSTATPGMLFRSGGTNVNNYNGSGPTTTLRIDNLKSGDLIDVTFNQNSGSSVNIGATSRTQFFFQGERLSGPATIAASEAVYFHAYKTTTDQNISASSTAVITFNNIELNSHGAFASDKFTAPLSGVYEFIGRLNISAASNPTANSYFRVNGSTKKSFFRAFINGASTGPLFFINQTMIRLSAGDYVEFVGSESSGSATWTISTATSGESTWVSFSGKRIGN